MQKQLIKSVPSVEVTALDELEEEVRRGAAWALEVPPKVVKRIKEDYLASKEFQEENFECAMDEHSRGFKECVHQVRELDPNFDVTRLKEDAGEEERSDQREL